MSPQTQNAPDWEGRTLLDRAGEKVGTIEEIYIVEETGRPEWALVKAGGRLKSRTTLVPLAGARAVAKGVQVAYEKNVIDEAPRVANDDDLSEQRVTEVYRHYGIAADGGAATGAAGATDGADGAAASRPEQQSAAAASRPEPHGARPMQQRREPARAAAPGRPRTERGSRQQQSGGSTLKRTVKEFSDDNLTHWAAALTYYGVLSIFPALLALVAILGLLGSSAIEPLIDNLGSVAPGPAKEIVTSALQGLQSGGGGSGVLFVLALAGAIWSASGYISGFMDASNAIYDIEEGRPIWKKLPMRVGITLLMLVLLSAGAVAVVLTGPVAEQAGKLFGVGDSALALWDIVKWPVLVLIASFMFAVLYYAAPNVRQPGLKSVIPGGLLAVILWILVSVAFAFYVATFGSYNKTYGALGGVIVFLVWLWLTNLAILLGAEYNAERARGRFIEAGHSPDQEPYLPPRTAA